MTLEAVTSYLRVTDSADDDLIRDIMMPAAAEYMAAGFGSFDESKSRMKIAFLCIMQDLYDNRELVRASGKVEKNLIQASLGTQFFAEELLEEDTGGA